MDKKNNKLVLICLLSSIMGIVLIYVAAIKMQPTLVELEEISPTFIGKTVTTEGYVSYKSSHPAGHLFLTIVLI